MNIYLAARYSRREELLRYASDLREVNHEVTSRFAIESLDLARQQDGKDWIEELGGDE